MLFFHCILGSQIIDFNLESLFVSCGAYKKNCGTKCLNFCFWNLALNASLTATNCTCTEFELFVSISYHYIEQYPSEL